jgi:hypothetical protein
MMDLGIFSFRGWLRFLGCNWRIGRKRRQTRGCIVEVEGEERRLVAGRAVLCAQR